MTLVRNRGYSAIGLFRPKHKENVGSAMRAASVYGASMVAIQGARCDALYHGTNTTKTQRRVPTIMTDNLLDVRPFDCQIVVVDLIDGATALPDFAHPERAMYVFGPEDGTLGFQHTQHAQHVVYVPGNSCMNLAATVNVILYDRMVKRSEWQGGSVVERRVEGASAAGSIPALATT